MELHGMTQAHAANAANNRRVKVFSQFLSFAGISGRFILIAKEAVKQRKQQGGFAVEAGQAGLQVATRGFQLGEQGNAFLEATRAQQQARLDIVAFHVLLAGQGI